MPSKRKNMKMNSLSTLKNSNGMTLIEILISTLILSSLFVGAVYVFIKCMELSEAARNTQTATLICRNRMNQIEAGAYNQIYATYNQATFTSADLNGIGVSYIDNSDPDVLKVTSVFCWRQSNGRIYGEDLNLNGQIDGSEDANNNGQLDSPVKLVTFVYNT